jgi:alkanesulfonate monooxygenase SsuD/methylene tetrahydromethanopterin reductase-like flavin-dependent oxidoreductase (luciferase family)
MRFGLSFPPFNQFCDARLMAEMAHEAEQAGWDAFFLWDHMLFDGSPRRVADPWVVLSAIAWNTQTIRLGTLLTPIPRRRPWKLARETATLDILSGGRLILGVGLGWPLEVEYGRFHEDAQPKVLAEKLDEGLQILTGLWSGQPFNFKGKHYHLAEMTFLPTPRQTPRVPIWVGGMWPNKAPFRRAAKWDGVCPIGMTSGLSPEDFADLQAYIRRYRTTDEPYDFVAMGITPGDDPDRARDIVSSYAITGANWWIEDASPYRYGWDEGNWSDAVICKVRERVRQGPPGPA